MNREQKLQETQRIYNEWVKTAKFETETSATAEDEERLYDALIKANLTPIEENKQG
tara:strand:+ start:441 stop:608 length:168 start_codon:yes stop_codon:yes gene_type:complete